METTCQASYPLNSEKASPPGTLRLYLSCCAKAKLPKAASDTAMITIAGNGPLFMAHSSRWRLRFNQLVRLTGRRTWPLSLLISQSFCTGKGSPPLAADKSQEVLIDHVGMRGEHAVRESWIDF